MVMHYFKCALLWLRQQIKGHRNYRYSRSFISLPISGLYQQRLKSCTVSEVLPHLQCTWWLPMTLRSPSFRKDSWNYKPRALLLTP